MASCLREICRGGDNDNRKITVAESQGLAGQENKKMTSVLADWFENRSQSTSDIPEITERPRRPSTLRLFGNSKKLSSDVNSDDSETRSIQLVENVVKEFEDNYNSPTKTPSKKSKNFVKKLVAALERRQRDNEVDEVFSMRYSSGPIYAYENSGTIRKSQANRQDRDETKDHPKGAKFGTEKPTVKAEGSTASKIAPKIIGAFLKKPVKVEDTSIFWIPITDGEKLPRKKSFKQLLAKLTGRNGDKRSEKKTKQEVFAVKSNLIEETHDSGYEGKSTPSSTSSVTSFAHTLMHHNNNYMYGNNNYTYDNDNYIDKAYCRDCNFKTFVTSSPMKTTEVNRNTLDNKSKDLSKLFPEEKVTSDVAEIREDSGYISNHSIFDESLPKKNLVATGVQEIGYQLAKLPKHPYARSEPRLHQQDHRDHHLFGEIITLRKCQDEPIYDVPQPRPRSSIFDESLSMKRRNLPVQTVVPLGQSGYSAIANIRDDEQPHYATVKPRSSQSRVSFESLCPGIYETPEGVFKHPTVFKKSLHFGSADLTSSEAFLMSLYV